MKDPAPLYPMLSRLGNGLSPLRPLKQLQVAAAPVPRAVRGGWQPQHTLHVCSFTFSGGPPSLQSGYINE